MTPSAADTSEAPEDEARAKEARRAFEAGVEASRTSRWEDARRAFQRSAELAPKASTFFNLAVVCVRSARGEAALEALDRFEALAQPDAHAAMLEKAPQLRTEARGFVAQRVQAPEVTPSAQPAHAPPPPPPVDLTRPRRTVIAGAVLGGVAVGLGVAAVTRRSALDRCENDGPAGIDCPEHAQIARQRSAMRATAIVVGVGALAAITVGSVRLVQKHNAHAELAVGPLGASLRGQF